MPALDRKKKASNPAKKQAKKVPASKGKGKVAATQTAIEAPPKKKKKKEHITEVHPEQTAVAPFSDGIVSAKFCTMPAVLHAGGPEVDLLRGALHYFAVTEPYIGNINTKVSFMKKKGGRLL